VDAAIAAYAFAESEGRQIILSVAGEDRLGDLTKLSMQVDAAVRLIREAGKAAKIKGEFLRSLFDCQSELSGETACLAEVIRRHEAVRLEQCKKRTAQRTGGAAITLEDFAEDEFKAYEAERKYILSVMDALLCRPKSWFGTVTYTQTKKFSSERTNSRSSRSETVEAKETKENTEVRSGVIRVVDSTGDQSETYNSSNEQLYSNHGQGPCPGRKGIYPYSETVSDGSKGNDQATDSPSPSFQVSERYPPSLEAGLSFRMLPHKYKSDFTHNSQGTSTCGREDKASNSGTGKEFTYVDSKLVGVKGQLSRDGLTFSGNQTIRQPELNSTGNPKVTTSNELTVTWSLHRLPR
jgi:hypothetical protein